MGQSSRELNKAHWQPNTAEGGTGFSGNATIITPVAIVPGSSGSAWRMSKLKRTYEAAEEEGRSLEEIVLERYGSTLGWEEAKEERRVLDERDDRRRSRGSGAGTPRQTYNTGKPTDRRFVYNDSSAEGSRPSSRNEFRRPGESLEGSDSSSAPRHLPSVATPVGNRTPVPSVFTPPISRTPRGIGATSNLSHTANYSQPTATSATIIVPSVEPDTPILTQSELNKLQATVLKAKLLDSPDAAKLEADYEKQRVRTLNGVAATVVPHPKGATVQVLPTLDGHGRLYDVGQGIEEADEMGEGNKKRKKDKVSAVTFSVHWGCSHARTSRSGIRVA